MKAVVLLSGGLDSATTLAIARKRDGCSCAALSFDYGQRHSLEVSRAALISHYFGAVHKVLHLDPIAFKGSALTDASGEVPKSRRDEMAGGIPVTYVPARNTIFLAHALGAAEHFDCGRIYIGVNAVDYSGYPDCRPEFIEAFQRMANLATKRGIEGNPIEIRTPLIDKSKAEIIRVGADLGVPFELTLSCYDPDPHGYGCGECDSCQIRRQGFIDAMIEDLTDYAGGTL